jgi:hypothetical protein
MESRVVAVYVRSSIQSFLPDHVQVSQTHRKPCYRENANSVGHARWLGSPASVSAHKDQCGEKQKSQVSHARICDCFVPTHRGLKIPGRESLNFKYSTTNKIMSLFLIFKILIICSLWIEILWIEFFCPPVLLGMGRLNLPMRSISVFILVSLVNAQTAEPLVALQHYFEYFHHENLGFSSFAGKNHPPYPDRAPGWAMEMIEGLEERSISPVATLSGRKGSKPGATSSSVEKGMLVRSRERWRRPGKPYMPSAGAREEGSASVRQSQVREFFDGIYEWM